MRRNSPLGSFGRNKWARGLGDLIFPRRCLASGDPVEEDAPLGHFSWAGWREFEFIEGSACERCGSPLLIFELGQCNNCRELQPAYDEGRTLFLLRGSGRQLIHELKYRRGHWLAPDLRRLLHHSPSYREFLAGALLVPVPLHCKRLRRRGFNQARRIAQAMATAADGCAIADLLVRTTATRTQTALDRDERQRNVKGAFAVTDAVPLGKRILLVDDVFTTGSTLAECAETLKAYGAKRVGIATLGHG